jgi:hypothetical protein
MVDHRYTGREIARSRRFDEERMILMVSLWDGDDEEEVELPAVYEVCPTCEGKGRHVNPAIDDRGISAEEFAEDPEFERCYRRGVYDVSCYECGGRRVIPVPDRDAIDGVLMQRVDDQAWEDHVARVDMLREREMGY